jgi:hypothetical protein
MNRDSSLRQRVEQRRQAAFEREVERQAAERLEESEQLERSFLKTPEEQIAKSLDDLKRLIIQHETAPLPQRSWLSRVLGRKATEFALADEILILGSWRELSRHERELVARQSRLPRSRSYLAVNLPTDEQHHDPNGTVSYYWSVALKTGPRPPGSSSWLISRIAESEQGKESMQAFKINTHVDRKNYVYRSNIEVYQEDDSWSASTPGDQLLAQSLINQACQQLKAES